MAKQTRNTIPKDHDRDAVRDLSDLFGDIHTAVPQDTKTRKGQKRRLNMGAKDDVFVEELLRGKTALEINESLGRHRHSGKPKNKYFKQRLKERQDEERKKMKITSGRVLKEMARIAFVDPRAFFDDEGNPIPITRLDRGQAAAIAGLEIKKLGKDEGWAEVVKYRLADKLKALDQLGRSLGVFEKDNAQKTDIKVQDETSDTEKARRIAFFLQESLRNAVKNDPETGA